MEKKRVKCLYRVSTKKQVENDDIPMQRQYFRDFATQHPDWEIIDEVYEKGVSGYKVHAEDRDELNQLRNDALGKKFDVLLVYMSDRIGRMAYESALCAYWFVEQGIEVWSATEGQLIFDTSSDKLLNFFLFLKAEGESEKTSIRTKTRLGQIVLNGWFRGGVAPYGYRVEKRGRLNVRGEEVNDIFIDEEEAVIVRYIFDLSAIRGYGGRKIASTLRKEGYYNRNGKPFHPATIQNMLKNIMYMGILRSGESRSEIFPDLQIIPPELFELAQQQIASHRSDYEAARLSPMKAEGHALLSGNVYCGMCGARLNATTVRATHHPVQNGENRRVPIYRCYNRLQHKGVCEGPTSYRADKVDGIVEEAVKEILGCIQITDFSEYMAKQRQAEAVAFRSQLKRLEKEYKSAFEERSRLARHIGAALDGQGPFTAEELKEQMDTLQGECNQISAQMEQQKQLLSDSENREKMVAQQFELLKGYAEVYEGATFEEKRKIVSALIERVEVSRGYQVKIQFRVGLDLLEDLQQSA